MKIYVASSWSNPRQPEVVEILRAEGHEVYDFRHPGPGNNGFQWWEIDLDWQAWELPDYILALQHPIARRGFNCDLSGMKWADCCVLVLPCGRSAHLEAGWFVGVGKPLHILLSKREFKPELMYKMATSVACRLPDLVAFLRENEHGQENRHRLV